jgi:hypothetical protein
VSSVLTLNGVQNVLLAMIAVNAINVLIARGATDVRIVSIATIHIGAITLI